MDWLLLFWIFGGSRRHVLVETPEQREQRQRREAEAWARLVTGAGKFLTSGVGMIIVLALLWAAHSLVLDIVTEGNVCSPPSDPTSLSGLIRLLARC
jgi:hypothetical protein